ncbi:uncharacterized protein B0I36DRAFT_317925 [Microdochium trichocladiopsis]|uniref:Uncharacterized protein n=1 Tax=Microdochium trichocladiopsis TaxID=1682393 RepID=A0A9P9BT87_9PEZI|nr:uncharacterized protein B0I36DRAFT_317925 [Microdochium trichocladiopsis]KAH7035237.1 hypothetical protein B0I36DRAFT_317925 [Microdochium trichocladiopsis]
MGRLTFKPTTTQQSGVQMPSATDVHRARRPPSTPKLSRHSAHSTGRTTGPALALLAIVSCAQKSQGAAAAAAARGTRCAVSGFSRPLSSRSNLADPERSSDTAETADGFATFANVVFSLGILTTWTWLLLVFLPRSLVVFIFSISLVRNTGLKLRTEPCFAFSFPLTNEAPSYTCEQEISRVDEDRCVWVWQTLIRQSLVRSSMK